MCVPGRGRLRVFCYFSISLQSLAQSPQFRPWYMGRFRARTAFAQQMLECKRVSSGCRCPIPALWLFRTDLLVNWWKNKPWICFSSQQGRNLAKSTCPSGLLPSALTFFCSHFLKIFFFPPPTSSRFHYF